ncbi:MAG: ParB/RepB/Spo0J family partition protein [Eubacteriales bacterium]|nr:ParB/RepB/Spo0J family partition protein [Eubacteriales bacterium]
MKMLRKKEKIVYIPVSEILPNPNQPRSYFDDDSLNSLAESIKRFGIIQPLTVKRRDFVPKMNINGQFVTGPSYEIIAGERRWRAAKKIGQSAVPCLITDCDPENMAYLAFSENVFREDLTFFDIASSLQDMLIMTHKTQTELAEKLAISQSAIANKLRLLRLSPADREEILKGKLTEKHARALIRLEDEDKRREFLRKAVMMQWSAQETDKKINAFLNSPEARNTKAKFRGKKIGILSDIGIFINSIDNAVRMVRDVGVNVERKEVDMGDSIEIIIKVPKSRQAVGI